MDTKEIWAVIEEHLSVKWIKDENGNERKVHYYTARPYHAVKGMEYAGDKSFMFEVSDEDDEKWMLMEFGVYLLTLEERENDGVTELICRNAETE